MKPDQPPDLASYAKVRLHRDKKVPVAAGWTVNPLPAHQRIDVSQYGVGLVCGPLSGGLFCVDLDLSGPLAEEALIHCNLLLPHTDMKDSRPGRLGGHHWYVLEPQEWSDECLPKHGSEVRAAMDEGRLQRFPGVKHLNGTDCVTGLPNGLGIDLLGAGGQCCVPPTLSKNGAPRVWELSGDGRPTVVRYDYLMERLTWLCETLGMPDPRRRQEPAAPQVMLEPSPASLKPASPLRFEVTECGVSGVGNHLSAWPICRRSALMESFLRAAPPTAHGAGHGHHGQQYSVACAFPERGIPESMAGAMFINWARGTAGAQDSDTSLLATLSKAYRCTSFGSELLRLSKANPIVKRTITHRPIASKELSHA